MSQNGIHRIIVDYLWIGARIRFATEESFALFIPISMAEDFGCRGIFNAEKARRQQHQFIVILMVLGCEFFSMIIDQQIEVIGAVYAKSFGVSASQEIVMLILLIPWLHQWLHTCLSGCSAMPAIWDDQVQI